MNKNLLRSVILLILLCVINLPMVFSHNSVMGDVNNDWRINIVDALFTARYYIGIKPLGFNSEAADVDGNNTIDIVDAFFIAQYYVGLREKFPMKKQIFTFTGQLNNGRINGAPVKYTTYVSYSGGVATINFNGGPGFEWVWLFSPGHLQMKKSNGTNWTMQLKGYSEGQTLEYYFTVRKDGQEVNNHNKAHRLVIGSSTQGCSGPSSSGHGNQSGNKSWKMVWEDQFDGKGKPNSSNWNYHVGNGYNKGSKGFSGWGNGEWEWYRPENAYQEKGNLVIKAEYDSNPTKISNREWYQFSSRITTQGKRSWKYGRFEARIALPSALGTWPAFWMLGTSCDASYTSKYQPSEDYYDHLSSNWPACGEIDIMEHRNKEDRIVHNLFWDYRNYMAPWDGGGVRYDASENVPVNNITQFHLYTVEWDINEIRWYVDRDKNPKPTKIKSITAANEEEFHKPFFLILNLAIQGKFTGPKDPVKSDFPLYMYVDYVRVWQKK